jgi:hypothetical protein
MDTLFSQAVDKLFPNLDQETKKEIYERVSAHLSEVLKEAVFQDNPEELNTLNDKLKIISDVEERSKKYGEEIGNKLQTLSESRQKEISFLLDQEMTRVMHEVYKIVNNS